MMPMPRMSMNRVIKIKRIAACRFGRMSLTLL
jgi:hypothetical protein